MFTTGEIRQTNFRIDQRTADLFRKFCDENDFSQAQGFDHLMQVLEMDQAKAIVPGRKTEIEEFEKAIKSINALYLQNIELCEDAEDRAREQFSGQLKSKDQLIADLQTRLEKAEEEKKTAQENQNAAEKSRKMAESRAETAEREREAAEKTAADKEQINGILSEKLAGQEKALAERDDLSVSLDECRRRTVDLESRLKDSERMIKFSEEQLKIQTELAAEKAAREAEKVMMEKIREADRENARLQATIEQLTSRIESLTLIDE